MRRFAVSVRAFGCAMLVTDETMLPPFESGFFQIHPLALFSTVSFAPASLKVTRNGLAASSSVYVAADAVVAAIREMNTAERMIR